MSRLELNDKLEINGMNQMNNNVNLLLDEYMVYSFLILLINKQVRNV